MSEQKKTEYINVPVDEEEYERITREAEEYGSAGRAPLLRLVARKVREFGDGNLVDGIAKLRFIQNDEMVFADDTPEAETQDE